MNKTVEFLTNLKANNSKEWLENNRVNYHLAKKEFLEFVEQVIRQCQLFDDKLTDISPERCIFRLNRDVRFSKDKSPYKLNFGASINPGGKKSTIPGYYVHIEPGKSFLAIGSYMPPANYLSAIRQEIDYHLDEFISIISEKKFVSTFTELSTEDALKTVPKGYDKDNPAISFLKLKHFIVIKELEDKILFSNSFAKICSEVFSVALPLNQFLRRAHQDTEHC